MLKMKAGREIKYYFPPLRHNYSVLRNDLTQFLGKKIHLYRKYEDEFLIRRLHFEVTNVCNARCIFCGYRYMNQKKGIMEFDVFQKALEEYICLGGKVVDLTPVVGDPLLDPGLIKKIEFSASKKCLREIYLFTNGINLNHKNLYERLLDSGIHRVVISCPGFEKETYESTYGVRCYESFIEGVHLILKNNRERVRIDIIVRSPLSPRRIETSPDFITYVEPYLKGNVKINYSRLFDNWGGMIRRFDLRGFMWQKRLPLFTRIPCWRTFEPIILFDGSVRLCACRAKDTEFDELVVGNIGESSLADIYYGEDTKTLRRRFTEGDPPSTCRKCSHYWPVDKRWLEIDKTGMRSLDFD